MTHRSGSSRGASIGRPTVSRALPGPWSRRRWSPSASTSNRCWPRSSAASFRSPRRWLTRSASRSIACTRRCSASPVQTNAPPSLSDGLASLASARASQQARHKSEGLAAGLARRRDRKRRPPRRARPTRQLPSTTCGSLSPSWSRSCCRPRSSSRSSSPPRSAAQRLQDVRSRLETWKRELYQARVSGDPDKIQEFLEWNTSLVDGLVADVRMLASAADDERRTIGPMVDELLGQHEAGPDAAGLVAALQLPQDGPRPGQERRQRSRAGGHRGRHRDRQARSSRISKTL